MKGIHYDALADGKLTVTHVNTEALLPTLNPTEVVGIIMAHNNYQDLFVNTVSVDLKSYCSSKIDIQGTENAWLKDDHNVEENFSEVCKYFYLDPI